MAVYVCGDIHIPSVRDFKKLTSKWWPEKKDLTKDDYLIILGDVGLIWYELTHHRIVEEIYWKKWFQDAPFTTLFIDGNHENHPRLQELERVKMFGGTVGKVSDNIFHLRRGEIYTIEGKKIFTFGGASSWDKSSRTEWIDWWSGEVATWTETEFALENLENNGSSVDFILTHTAPKDIGSMLVGEKVEGDPTCDFLSFIAQYVNFKEWHFGHFHMDKQISSKYFVHYNGKPKRII